MPARGVERRTERCRPQTGDDLQLLLEPVEPLTEWWELDAVRLVFGFVPSGAEPEFDPAGGHVVDLGNGDRQWPRETECGR